MKKFFVQKLKGALGISESVEFLGVVVLLLAVFYVLMLSFAPLMKWADFNIFTKTLVRQIEIHGAIDAEIDDFAAELAEIYGLDPKITYDAVYVSGTNHIQIRDSFKVTLKDEAKLVLLDGSIFRFLTITIPLTNEKVGISEKLWK
jgi:ethanolamine transporter EutH